MPDLPAGTLTLFFIDIEGSTRLLHQLGQKYAGVLADCRRLMQNVFLQYNGHEVDTQGDAFFVVFARATDAIAAAIALRHSHLYQLSLEDLPNGFPPLKTLDTHPNNLPIQPTPFIGRVKEVVAVTRLLKRSDVRLVTLSGPGGVGKTRLALHVAAELAEDFLGGVFVVALAPVNDPAQVVPAIAQTLAISQASDRPLFSLLQAFLKGKQVLLLLDNFEQVGEAAVGWQQICWKGWPHWWIRACCDRRSRPPGRQTSPGAW